MGRRLILDASALIAYERGSIDCSTLDDDELAVAAVTIAEYRIGIELGEDARAGDRRRALAAIRSAIDILDYTEATAGHHARLIAHVRKLGKPRRAHDLIIAAHAVQTDRVVLSTDAAGRFGGLPGVAAVQA